MLGPESQGLPRGQEPQLGCKKVEGERPCTLKPSWSANNVGEGCLEPKEEPYDILAWGMFENGWNWVAEEELCPGILWPLVTPQRLGGGERPCGRSGLTSEALGIGGPGTPPPPSDDRSRAGVAPDASK